MAPTLPAVRSTGLRAVCSQLVGGRLGSRSGRFDPPPLRKCRVYDLHEALHVVPSSAPEGPDLRDADAQRIPSVVRLCFLASHVSGGHFWGHSYWDLHWIHVRELTSYILSPHLILMAQALRVDGSSNISLFPSILLLRYPVDESPSE